MTAFVKVAVVPLPQSSGVNSDESPDRQTANVAFSSLQQKLKTIRHYCNILSMAFTLSQCSMQFKTAQSRAAIMSQNSSAPAKSELQFRRTCLKSLAS